MPIIFQWLSRRATKETTALILRWLWLFKGISLRFSLWVHKIFRHKSFTSFQKTLHKFNHWFKSFPLFWPVVPQILLNQHQKHHEVLSFCFWHYDFCKTCNQAFKKFQNKNGLWDQLWCQELCEPEFFSEKHSTCFLWAKEKNIIFQFYVFPLKIQTVVIRLGPADDDIGVGTLLGSQNEPISSEREENYRGHRLLWRTSCSVETSLVHSICFKEFCLWQNAKCVLYKLKFDAT